MWATIIPSAISLISEGVKGFFGIQQSKSENVAKAVEALNQANISAAEREKAIAAVVTAEASSGYWLAACWRPLLMVILAAIIVAYSLGYTTPNLIADLPADSFLSHIFELLKIGVMGYMPLRSIEKIATEIMKPKVIETLLKHFKR